MTDESANRRDLFRVPVFSNSGLSCQLFPAGVVVHASVCNLSLSGMAIRVAQDEMEIWEIGLLVPLQLRLSEDLFECAGKVNRAAHGNVSFRFPVAGKPSEFRPPQPLMRIMMNLQRDLLLRELKRRE